jgi:glycosyltransferase involved in cell wall biosynthesis
MKKTIGILHYQLGRTDGVSLEVDKWKQILEEMGHPVHLCAGDLGAIEGDLIEELYHHRPDAERLYYNTFTQFRDYANEGEYKAEMERLAQVIERKLRDFVVKREIDFLIVQNIWSVACSPPASIALARLVRDLQIPTLSHNHDFYWERTDRGAPTCAAAVEIAGKYIPPRDPLIRHIVINSLTQREMAERKDITATVVPNVFDFDAPPWEVDEYNQDFRAALGLKENDVLILQATRVVPRKGIELAVDFVKTLNAPQRRACLKARGLYNGRPFDEDSRIVLVMAGYTRDEVTGRYLKQLKQKIKRAGIEALFIEDMVGGQRRTQNGNKVYSLWDTYVFADFITYPSLWEGWGNQFLEALQARLPLMLFEYPVYRADIKEKGFRVVSLGSEIQGRDDLNLVQVAPQILETAADQAVELLTNAPFYQQTVEHNFQLGRQHYSLAALRDYLEKLIA